MDLKPVTAAKHWWQNTTKDETLPESTYVSSSSKKFVAWWSTFSTQSGLKWVLCCGQEGVFVWSGGQRDIYGDSWKERLPSWSLLCSAIVVHINF